MQKHTYIIIIIIIIIIIYTVGYFQGLKGWDSERLWNLERLRKFTLVPCVGVELEETYDFGKKERLGLVAVCIVIQYPLR